MDDLKKYSPVYRHINDTLAFVVHLSFLKQNCKLIGLNEEQYLKDIGSIPQQWNKSNEIYQFRYIAKEEEKGNDEHKNTILVKILAMQENELLISAVRQSSNDIVTLEITLNDHIHSDKAAKNLNQYNNVYKDINGLIVLINDQITNKVIPQRKKEQQGNEDKNKNKKKKDNNDANPLIFPDPNPNPNPLFIGGGRGGMGGGVPFGGGFGGDMDPFGGGGGNLMGPNQINQQWRNRNNPNNNNNNNNKPPLVPPGARFDPFGPGGNYPAGPDPDHFNPPGGGRGGGGLGGLGGFGGGFM